MDSDTFYWMKEADHYKNKWEELYVRDTLEYFKWKPFGQCDDAWYISEKRD